MNALRTAVEDMNIHHRCLDVIVESGRSFPMSLFRGMAETSFHCAHRAIVVSLNDPSKLACIFFTRGWSAWPPTARNFLTRSPTGRYFSPTQPSDCFAIDFPRRAISPSEHLLSVRVARAKEANRPPIPSFSFSPTSLSRGAARLSFPARIGRAPSERARSAGKKGTWPLPLCSSLRASSDFHLSQ
jgi:hypothetical protein